MFNQCQFIGNLGADPEVKEFQSGGRIANLRLAVSESWKDKNSGEKKERTEWVNIVVNSEGLIGVIERFVRKGSKIFVSGKMRTRKWQDSSGQDRYSTEIIVGGFDAKLVLLDGKQERHDKEVDTLSRAYGIGQRDNTPIPDYDDEVPF